MKKVPVASSNQQAEKDERLMFSDLSRRYQQHSCEFLMALSARFAHRADEARGIDPNVARVFHDLSAHYGSGALRRVKERMWGQQSTNHSALSTAVARRLLCSSCGHAMLPTRCNAPSTRNRKERKSDMVTHHRREVVCCPRCRNSEFEQKRDEHPVPARDGKETIATARKHCRRKRPDRKKRRLSKQKSGKDPKAPLVTAALKRRRITIDLDGATANKASTPCVPTAPPASQTSQKIPPRKTEEKKGCPSTVGGKAGGGAPPALGGKKAPPKPSTPNFFASIAGLGL